MRSYFILGLTAGLAFLTACRNNQPTDVRKENPPALAASNRPIRYDTIRYAKEHYRERVNLFKSEAPTKGSIIFLGNSITEFGDWKGLLGDSTVINRGIAADNSFGVLDRLDEVSARRPNKLFVEIGINDIAQNIPVDTIIRNFDAIVAEVKAKSPGTQIYVHSILPTNDNVKNEYPELYQKNEQVNLVDRQLQQRGKGKGFTYIDLGARLRDKNGRLDLKYAEPDGLHLNKAGYDVWIRLLREKGYL